MKEGDVLITVLAQSDGTVKHRPVLYRCEMPPFGDFLVCGISTKSEARSFGNERLTATIAMRSPEIADYNPFGKNDLRRAV